MHVNSEMWEYARRWMRAHRKQPLQHIPHPWESNSFIPPFSWHCGKNRAHELPTALWYAMPIHEFETYDQAVGTLAIALQHLRSVYEIHTSPIFWVSPPKDHDCERENPDRQC